MTSCMHSDHAHLKIQDSVVGAVFGVKQPMMSMSECRLFFYVKIKLWHRVHVQSQCETEKLLKCNKTLVHISSGSVMLICSFQTSWILARMQWIVLLQRGGPVQVWHGHNRRLTLDVQLPVRQTLVFLSMPTPCRPQGMGTWTNNSAKVPWLIELTEDSEFPVQGNMFSRQNCNCFHIDNNIVGELWRYEPCFGCTRSADGMCCDAKIDSEKVFGRVPLSNCKNNVIVLHRSLHCWSRYGPGAETCLLELMETLLTTLTLSPEPLINLTSTCGLKLN